MLEDDRIVCGHCERIIRYERPNFCPYCGQEIDASQGLVDENDTGEVYRVGRVAPAAMRLLFYWALLIVPVTLIWGRTGFAVLGMVFVVAEIGLLIWAALSFRSR